MPEKKSIIFHLFHVSCNSNILFFSGTEIPTTTTTTSLTIASSVPVNPSAGQSSGTQVDSSGTSNDARFWNSKTEFFISQAQTSDSSFASQEALCRKEGGQAAHSLSMAQIEDIASSKLQIRMYLFFFSEDGTLLATFHMLSDSKKYVN